MLCGSHSQSIVPRRDRLAVLDHQLGAVGDVVLLELAALGVEDQDLAVAARGRSRWPCVVDDDVDADVLDRCRRFLALTSLLLDAARGDAADVERPHRQLRARLADRLGGDDADGHALLDQRAGGQVHAVAAAGRRPARPRRSSGCGPGSCRCRSSSSLRAASEVIISFSSTITSSVIGLTMLTRLTRPRIDSDRLTLDLLALVDDPLGDALRGAAVVHRDDDVLGHVGQLAGQVARVGRLQGRVGQPLAGAVRRAEVLQHASGPRGSWP